MRRASLLAFILALAWTSGVHAQACVGAFADRNGDGLRQRGERPVPGVAILQSGALIRTGADGRAVLRSGEAVAIKPAALSLPHGGDGMPQLRVDRLPLADGCHALAMRPRPAATGPLEVLVFGDPQPKSLVDVGHYARDIVEPLLGRQRARLGLSLGDIVDDRIELYPAMKAATARLQLPWLHVPGNHDVDPGAASDDSALHGFKAAFGADSFAWEEPEASFVVLDDVLSSFEGGRHRYIGGLREDQFAFLSAYLPTLPRQRLLVLALHIPLFEPEGRETFRDADRERLFALLRDFPQVLVLSAHTHVQQHVFHGPASGWHGQAPLHEYNVGAACGAFWSGIADARGIPDATMADGTPNGHALLTVQPDGRYALDYRPAPGASHPRIGLHAPRVLRHGAYPAWGVYANVWMGMDDTRVEFSVDGGPWQPMRRVLQPDPALLAENARDDAASALRGYDRSPEAVASAHLWRAALPTDLAVGEHEVAVRAFDRWQGESRNTIRYRLEAAVR